MHIIAMWYMRIPRNHKRRMFSIVYEKKIKRHTKLQWQKLTCGKHPIQQITRRREITPNVHIIKSPIDWLEMVPLPWTEWLIKYHLEFRKRSLLRVFRKSMKIFLICWREKTSSHVENCHCRGKSLRLEEPSLSRC